MKYISSEVRERFKYYEVAPDVYAAITPYRGLCWATAGYVNKGKGLMYDTLFDIPHAKELRQFAVDKSGKVPAYVVSSHYNCDHTWGNQVFDDSCLIMHQNCEWERKSEDPNFWRDVLETGQDPDSGVGKHWLWQNIQGFDLTGVHWKEPDVLIKEDTIIKLSDTEFHILNVAPSHSNSDLIGWLPKEKVVFVGDLVFIGLTIYSLEGGKKLVNVLNWIVDELKPDVVVPGHGPICGKETVLECRDYLINIMEQFEKYYTPDIDPVELAKKIDVSRFLHWIQPERVFLSVNPILRSTRKESMVPDWDYNARSMVEIAKFHRDKYGDRIGKWDPMISWAP